MRGNFGLFRTFSPKLPRIHVDYIVMQMRKINREKGYSNDGSSSGNFALLFVDMQPRKRNRIFFASEQRLQRQQKVFIFTESNLIV